MPEQREATREVVVTEVSRHPEGIDAAKLGEDLVSQGFGRNSIQKAIRHSLDRGEIELGPRFRLQKRAA